MVLKKYICPTSQAVSPRPFPEAQEKQVTRAEGRVAGRAPARCPPVSLSQQHPSPPLSYGPRKLSPALFGERCFSSS